MPWPSMKAIMSSFTVVRSSGMGDMGSPQLYAVHRWGGSGGEVEKHRRGKLHMPWTSMKAIMSAFTVLISSGMGDMGSPQLYAVHRWGASGGEAERSRKGRLLVPRVCYTF